MTVSLDWRLIANGATFEALVSLLVAFEDPGAHQYGRAGKDASIDVLSGDGAIVYQSKFHRDGTFSDVLADAKKEAAKIRAYRQSGHPHYEKWKGVTHWRLCTNVPLNPNDEQHWKSEVEPLFLGMNIVPCFWAGRDLEARLIKYPELVASFFEGEIRTFLNLQEAWDLVRAVEPFLERASHISFQGRGDQLDVVDKFLVSDHRFLVFEGPGGIGKTRLLLEAGERIAMSGTWTVWWANPSSMILSSSWFRAIIPERPTVLLIDEPEDDQLLRVLVEQLGRSRTIRWKVILTVRSSKWPVLQLLEHPRLQRQTWVVGIPNLSLNDAVKMCEDLLRSGILKNKLSDEQLLHVARRLSERFDQYPLWYTLAVDLLEHSDGTLASIPNTSRDVANRYLDEVISPLVSPQTALALLRWVALIGPINLEDDRLLDILRQVSQLSDATALRHIFGELVRARVLVRRGVRSLLTEVKPDVIRDHLLISWLTEFDLDASPRRSSQTEVLVALLSQALLTGVFTSVHQSILVSLARIEKILSIAEVPLRLLDQLFADISNRVHSVPAHIRITIPEVMQTIAGARPNDIVAVSQLLRLSDVAEETIDTLFGSRVLGKDDVVFQLPWLVYHAAMGADSPSLRHKILTELNQLVEQEAAITMRKSLPNDGKRAGQLVDRLVAGNPEVSVDFFDAVQSTTHDMLANLSVTQGRVMSSSIRVFLEAVLSTERQRWWAEGYSFHVQTHLVGPGQPEWELRQEVRSHLKDLLAGSDLPFEVRRLCWDLLAESHTGMNRIRDKAQAHLKAVADREMLDDLVWVKSVITDRLDNTRELEAARKVWMWHSRFEQDPEIKAASLDLEAMYTQNSVIAEFESLLSADDWTKKGQRCADTAQQLVQGDASANISSFLARAIRFFTDRQDIVQILPVAGALGRLIPTNPSLVVFVKHELASNTDDFRRVFAEVMAMEWINELRAHGVADLLSETATDSHRVRLLTRIFDPTSQSHLLTPKDLELLRASENLFIRTGQSETFIRLVGGTFCFDWAGLRQCIGRILASVPDEQIDSNVIALIDSIHWAVKVRPSGKPPATLAKWLLGHVLQISDLTNQTSWYVEEIIQSLGPLPLTWLPQSLATRRDMERECGTRRVKAVNSHVAWARFVRPVNRYSRNNRSISHACEQLIEFAGEASSVGYYLPDIVTIVDPHGILIPGIVAGRIAATQTFDDVVALAPIAATYGIGSISWRQIAKDALTFAMRLPDRDRQSIYGVLLNPGMRSWSSAPGTVPEWVIATVESAQERLESETDPQFRELWAWHLAMSKQELQSWQDRIEEEKEEHGK